MSDEPRKATEILLSLEEKVITLTKIVSVYDMNTKIILDRVNKIYAYIEMLQREMAAEQIATPQIQAAAQDDKEIVETSIDNLITVSDKPMTHRRTPRAETYVSEVVPSVAPQAINPPQAKPDNDRKVPITQRITWQDAAGTAKDLFMAEISILNDQRELVLKTKTNAVGKWQAYLKPGMYTVNVLKTDTATKRKIESAQDIQVDDSKTTINLPTIIIKK